MKELTKFCRNINESIAVEAEYTDKEQRKHNTAK